MIKEWELYESGKKYNNKIDYYATVDTNQAFFNDDQWRNVEANDAPTPVFNIIKRVIQFFVASMTSSNVRIDFEPLLYADVNQTQQMQEEQHGAEIANATILNLFEKFKMEYKTREASFDAAITGDAAAHFYFDITKQPFGGIYSDIKGEIDMELVDGTNVMLGNANNPNIEIQPYVIVVGRDLVKNLQEEAKRYKSQPESIQEDRNYNEQSGDMGKIEVEADSYGKATYIIVYKKETKQRPKTDDEGNPVIDEQGKQAMESYTTITATKCVENAYIYQSIDTGLKHYPVAWLNWEKVKNTYHGRAVCTGIIPNQIFINKMFAMVMYHLMMSAFPKAVYDESRIESWNSEIGVAIPVSELQVGDNIKNIAGYLEPGNMSNQIINCIELAMQYTKETLGISDASLGTIDPKNTSAIIAVQKSSAIPLENPRANLYSWIEDIGMILLDMIGTYYGLRPIVIEKDMPETDEFGEPVIDELGQPKMTKQKVIEMFNFSTLKDAWFNIKCNVGESSYWSQIAANQTLDNLLQNGYIDIVDYLERVDEEYVPNKQELISTLKERMANMPLPEEIPTENTPPKTPTK